MSDLVGVLPASKGGTGTTAGVSGALEDAGYLMPPMPARAWAQDESIPGVTATKGPGNYNGKYLSVQLPKGKTWDDFRTLSITALAPRSYNQTVVIDIPVKKMASEPGTYGSYDLTVYYTGIGLSKGGAYVYASADEANASTTTGNYVVFVGDTAYLYLSNIKVASSGTYTAISIGISTSANYAEHCEVSDVRFIQ